MMRRGFWLLAGVVLGIAGYRRATRLARDLTRPARVTSAAGFVRDVRNGMAAYRDLQRGELDRTLGSRDAARASRASALSGPSDQTSHRGGPLGRREH